MRGKHTLSRAGRLLARITPAGAGKTVPVFGHRAHNRDHPRRCGENPLIQLTFILPPGITPAGAGKTRQPHAQAWDSQDHPRRCGENGNFKVALARKRGSPPQVRGKPSSFLHFFKLDRITPAGAGKTAPPSLCRWCSGDHPRRCGENRTDAAALTRRIGSPPQVRGKLAGWTEPVAA